MHSTNRLLAAIAVVISLPVLVTLGEAVSFSTRNQNNGSLVSSGERREYLLYVPHAYDPSRPTPLVISMHGAGGWPTQQMEVSRWNQLAESQRFLVVYPSGVDSPGARIWRVGPGDGLMKDVRFLSDLIDHLQASYNVDAARIYANGLSNGGGMSFVLSCTLSDRIAAVGLVAAAQTLPWKWCADRHAVPMIAFHGTADPMVPYEGGSSWVAPQAFPNVPAWAASWARRNGCAPNPLESRVSASVTRREYPECTDGAAVLLYTIRAGGHSWPGGGPLPEWFVGPTNRDIDATSLMWTFFREHPLRRWPIRTDRADGRSSASTPPFAAKSIRGTR